MNAVDLYYDFPSAAYLFFMVLFFLILFWMYFQYRQKILFQYADKSKLSDLLIPQSLSNYWIRAAGFCLAWIFLSLALMQPKGNAHYPPGLDTSKKGNINTLRLQPHEVIFLIDASASMVVPDGRLDRTRLDNAKEIADQTMSHLTGQTGSLYAFTSQISKLSPPSMDYLFMRMMLRNLAINEGDASGTDLKAALQYIHDNYLNPSTALIKTLIFISDGEDNKLQELKGDEQDKYIQDILALLGDTTAEKLHVYTIGVGSLKGGEIPNMNYEGKAVTSHLNETLLKALSDKGQGRYYSANEYAAADIAADLALRISQVDVFAPADLSIEKNLQENLIYDLYFQFPLGLAILLFGLCILWPQTSVETNFIPQRAQRA